MRQAMFLRCWADFPYNSFDYYLEEGVGWYFTGRIKYIKKSHSTQVLFEITEKEIYTEFPWFWIKREKWVENWKREDQFKWDTIDDEEPVEIIMECS